jgi:hypothetical protein
MRQSPIPLDFRSVGQQRIGTVNDDLGFPGASRLLHGVVDPLAFDHTKHLDIRNGPSSLRASEP